MRQPTDASGLPDQHGSAAKRETRAGSSLRRSDGITQAQVSTPKYKPIPKDHRDCLSRLIEMGRMIRRHDGSYGTLATMMIPNKIATALKGRRMAVAGFNSEIVPTGLGRRFNAESDNASTE